MYQKNEYLFIDENIKYQKKLNDIIHKFNTWQINGFDREQVSKLLSLIKHGKQTIKIGLDEFNKMENYIKSITK